MQTLFLVASMTHLFRDLTIGTSNREPTSTSAAAASIIKSSSMPIDPLPSPFGDLSPSAKLTAADLRLIAYDIFVASCRTSAGKTLAFVPSSPVADSSSTSSTGLSQSSSSVSSQRSLTSTAASKMKKAFGLRSSSLGVKNGSSGRDLASPGSKGKKAATIGELMRVQMRISETADSRVRRGLLRISAGQMGRRIESVVLPLELLQQFKSSDFTDPVEYDEWQKRNLRMLEAGLLLHPRVPISKSDVNPQRLR